MPSFHTSAAFVATALFIGARAQYSINITNVPLATRNQWCQSQMTECPLLCTQLPGESSTTEANSCDPATLNYSCVCGNGQSPNASEYSETIPYFICTEYGTECVSACGGITACQSACRDDNPCGAQSPVRINVTSTSSTQTATGTAGSSTSGVVVYTGLGGATTTPTTTSTSTKSGSQAALDLGRSYGLAVVLAGVFAGFTLVI